MNNYLIGIIELTIFSFILGVIFLWIFKGTHPYKTVRWFFGGPGNKKSDVMDDKRLKNIKILKPIIVNIEIVEEKIREHEKRFLYEKEVPIIITPLLTKEDYLTFLKPKEFELYKIKKDKEWGEHYNIKSLTIQFAHNIGKLTKIAAQQIKDTYRLLKTRNFPKRAIQPMVAIVSWHFTGYAGYEIWPWGENPYETTVELLELGYIPRRIKDNWLVGYVPKID